jgi:Tol biopolymer transport system component
MLVSDLTTLGTYPSWMPDGSEVVCLYSAPDQSSGGYVYSLIAVHVQTLAIRDLVDFQSVSQAGFVSINPTGQEAVLSVLPQAGIAQIWKIDLAAKKVIQLTTDGGDYPAWSPGGTWIVYTRVAEGDGGLWMMKADGSSKRRIT